ncbi:peptidylprolyl isomerase [Trypanosoma theileri]|uniref:Peptidyl-prolyl cis-trans isomerase n=1 Tax=Trypanosoma theileri TaxID=67003 RepID=A0A1X0NPJ0_9TRYP|nr:peptidylprolyl isomerase [Trypanosoma theileri]ORC86626.1 peptidylprolyl isomerase [Trypanosoma theileri]
MAEKLRAEHLLIKFSGSRNPVSRRTGKSVEGVSYEEARAELLQWAEKIRNGSITFEDAARQRSDCGSYASGGDLGYFGPGEMMKPFEDAVRALDIGQVSDIVQTDSGLHLIKRIA